VPFDLDCQDADYRRDPARPPAKRRNEQQAPAVGAEGPDAPATPMIGRKPNDQE
jgi:hypothetical protein